MANITDGVPALTGGISQQAPTVRFPSQVTDASNVDFDIAYGASKRPGTRFVEKLTTLTNGANYKLHPLDRDSSEKYVLVAGTDELNIYSSAGVVASVHRLSQARQYLSTATSSQLRLSSLGDTTIIANTTIATTSATSIGYAVASSHEDFNAVRARNPAAGAVLRARGSTVDEPAGYWKYNPGVGTFAQVDFVASGLAAWDPITGASSTYASRTYNPMGCRVFFSKISTAFTGATWVAATKLLTKTGAFTNLPATGTWWINLVSGTGAAADWYQIASKVSNDAVTLVTSPGANAADYAFTGIGYVGTIEVDFSGNLPATYTEIADAMTESLQASGAPDASVYVDSKIGTGQSTFHIVSPFAGTGSTFPATPVKAPISGGTYSLLSASSLFVVAGVTIVPGTGTLSTKHIPERWTRVAAPNQPKAVLDRTTMPVRLTRSAPAGVWAATAKRTTAWGAMTEALLPFAWWRLGESSATAIGGTAGEEISANNGVYTGSGLTAGATGAVNGDADTAVTMTASTSIVANGLPGWAALLPKGFTVEIGGYKSSTAAGQVIYISTDSSGNNFLSVEVVSTGGTAGRILAQLVGNGQILSGQMTGTAALLDGAYRHIAVVFDPTALTVVVYLNGTAQTMTMVSSQSVTSVSEFTSTTMKTTGTLDEVVLHPAKFTATMAAQRAGLVASATYSHPATFVLSTIPYLDRTSGGEFSNPLPTIVDRGLTVSDVAFFENRLVFSGGERIVMSGSNDFYRFFVTDTEQIADDDPIDIGLSSKQVTIIDSMVPVQQILQIFTRAAQQFELSSDKALSTTTVSIKATSAYPYTQGVLPAPSGLQTYFLASNGDALSMYEQAYSFQSLSMVAGDVSAHVPVLLPSSVRTIAAHPKSGRVFILPSEGATIYVYRASFQGNEKSQSAWTKWAFDSSYRIADVCVLGNSLFMLVQSQSQYVLESLPLGREIAASGYQHTTHLDRQTVLTGTFSAGTTTFTLPSSLSDTTINRAIKPDGTILTLTGVGTTATIAGDYSAGSVTVGRSFAYSMTLTRPFYRSQTGTPILWAWLQHKSQAWDLKDTRTMTFTLTYPNAASSPSSYAAPSAVPVSNAQFITNFLGDCAQATVTVTDSTPAPATLTSIMYDLQAEIR